MLDPKRLLEALRDDLTACREAGRFISTDEGRQIISLECRALCRHIVWVKSVGYDQSELERVIRSLEENALLSGYQRWRKRCEK